MASKKSEKIDFLKIDCEGLEWKVLKGIEKNDWKKILDNCYCVHHCWNITVHIRLLLSKHLLIQKTRLIVSECSQELKKAVDMNKTWCAPNNIRIGQCEDDIYVCLCSSPGDLGISE